MLMCHDFFSLLVKRLLLILIVAIFAFHTSISGQEKEQRKKKPNQFTYELGFTPSAMVNFFPAIQISNDLKLNNEWALATEAAYIFYSFRSPDLDAEGYRYKIGIERHFEINLQENFIIGLHYINRHTTEDREYQEYFIDGELIEYFNFQKEKKLSGLNLYIGNNFYFSEKISMEFGVGFGYGKIIVHDKNIEETIVTQNIFPCAECGIFDSKYDRQGEYGIPIIVCHLNLSILLFR